MKKILFAIPVCAVAAGAAFFVLKGNSGGAPAKAEASKSLLEKIKKSLGDKVQSVVASSRLTDTPAVIVVDDNAPTVQMQQILKTMGQPVVESKPILEVDVEDPMVKKLASESDEKRFDVWCGVLLDQALLAQGVMPKDPVAFTKGLHELLSK